MKATETTNRFRSALLAALACVILFPSVARGQQSDIQLALDKANLSVSGLSVVEAEGILILRGQVQRQGQIERVASVVRGLGYTRVAPLLNVVPLPDDDAIALNAERQLSMSRSMEGCRLVVRSTNGVVTIRGTVASVLQSDLARQIVARLEGVKAVKTQLQEV